MYYARLTISGKPTFRSLKTEVLSVAKPALKELLEDNAHRKELSDYSIVSEKMTGGDALALREHQFENDTTTKKKTKKYWREIVGLLKKTWPEFLKLEMRRISAEDCQEWAGKAVGQMASTRFNNTLLVLKSLFKLAIKRGVRRSNPALEVKRAKIRPRDLSTKLPDKARFQELVAQMRLGQGRTSQYRADLVEFLAYTGQRIGEAGFVTWRHCDFEKGEILVVGDPQDATKNGLFRRIPMIPAAKELLQRIKAANKPATPDEPVLRVKTAYAAMQRAAGKIKAQALCHHDLRHLFATICIESGVDVPTVSRWLGHQDGGILAMKVYGHLRNEHSLQAAARVSFAA